MGGTVGKREAQGVVTIVLPSSGPPVTAQEIEEETFEGSWVTGEKRGDHQKGQADESDKDEKKEKKVT